MTGQRAANADADVAGCLVAVFARAPTTFRSLSRFSTAQVFGSSNDPNLGNRRIQS
jgi:hypothetical protein